MVLGFKHDLFVNREKEINSVLEKVNLLKLGKELPDPDRVLRFSGVDGIGKSWLVQELLYRLQLEQVFSCLIDLREFPGALHSAPVDKPIRGILCRVAETVNQSAPGLISEAVYDDEASLNYISQYIMDGLRNFDRGHFSVFIFHHLSGSCVQFRDELNSRLLGRLIKFPRIIIVMIDDSPKHFWETTELRRDITAMSYFTEENTKEQLRRQVPDKEHLYRQIFEASKGSPEEIYSLAINWDTRLLTVVPEKEHLKMLLLSRKEKLLAGVPPNLVKPIEALCVFNGFTRGLEEVGPVLNTYIPEKQWDRHRLIELFWHLQELVLENAIPLVTWDKKNREFVMNEAVRQPVEAWLREYQPGAWLQLHQAALKIYLDMKTDIDPEDYQGSIWQRKAKYHDEQISNFNSHIEPSPIEPGE